MIWLASFPRSGNTFLRNVLYEVYGIESSTFHLETEYPLDQHHAEYPVVKTHLLPGQLIPDDPNIKSVYLVRDGRDALVSIAHHRKDLIVPHTDFEVNLLEAILAPKGSFFGGWSENVRQWSERADIIIRFEDLIKDPLRETEKLRAIMDLPPPRPEKLPGFKDLKFGLPKYGVGRRFLTDEKAKRDRADKFFRKGKAGGWKDDMPTELEELFWEVHGETMTAMGYERTRHQEKNQSVAAAPARKKTDTRPYKILIEGNKLNMPGNDGVKRYLIELLNSLLMLSELFPSKFAIDIYFDGPHFLDTNEWVRDENWMAALIDQETKRVEEVEAIKHKERPYENRLLQFKAELQSVLPGVLYQPLSWAYKVLPFRYLLRKYREAQVQKELPEHEDKFDQYDLIHIPLPQNFWHLKNVKGKFLVTVHDLTHKYFAEFHTGENVALSEAGMQQIIQKKAHVIAISGATKKDIQKCYPAIRENQISVIHEACNRDYFKPQSDPEKFRAILDKYDLPDTPYFLSLSTLEPRKNLLNTIKAFEQFVAETENKNIALFICGKKGWKTGELLNKENPSEQNIFFTGFVAEDDLPLLYAHAVALCYVSFYEGFGLPPLEAMACGTTVIYGKNSSMPEVIGDAGLAADPYNVGDIKKQMEIIVSDTEKRQELKELAIKRAHQFSWLKTGWETLRVYEKIIQGNNGDDFPK